MQYANIASDHGLSPVRRQAIIWTNASILSIRPQGSRFSEISFEIQQFSFKEMHLKLSSAKVAAILPGLHVLIKWCIVDQKDGGTRVAPHVINRSEQHCIYHEHI